MKNYGKKITLFLIDGVPNGRITCELSNWTGKAIKFLEFIYPIRQNEKNKKNRGSIYCLGKMKRIMIKCILVRQKYYMIG